MTERHLSYTVVAKFDLFNVRQTSKRVRDLQGTKRNKKVSFFPSLFFYIVWKKKLLLSSAIDRQLKFLCHVNLPLGSVEYLKCSVCVSVGFDQTVRK